MKKHDPLRGQDRDSPSRHDEEGEGEQEGLWLKKITSMINNIPEISFFTNQVTVEKLKAPYPCRGHGCGLCLVG